MEANAASACPDQVASAHLEPAARAVELLSGIDALYLSAKGTAPAVVFEQLDACRSAAEDANAPFETILGGYPVKVLPNAWGRYRFCARHELARLGFTPSERLPVVRIQPTAVALHALGPELTVLWARNFLDACGIEASLHVSRLDLHSDWQYLDITASERRNVVTYSNRRALYEVDEQLSGLTFGKRGGGLMCRIYDKSREMVDKGHDWWPQVWGKAYDPEAKVLRIEYEFSREGLRSFDVDTPEDAFTAAPALWAYATRAWLSLRIPTTDETRSRWPLDPRWQRIQGSSLSGGCAPAKRIREGERQGELRVLRKLASGILSSIAVPLGTDDIADTLEAIGPELELYEQISRRSFPDRITEKRQRR